MSRLDQVSESYNKTANLLESMYLDNREEPILTLYLDKQALEDLLLGATSIDNHTISKISYDGRDMKVILEKIEI